MVAGTVMEMTLEAMMQPKQPKRTTVIATLMLTPTKEPV